MKNLGKCLILLILPFSLSAQSGELSPEVVASAGDSFTSNNLILEWTLGELVTESFEGNLILSQGFHQPGENITSIESPLRSLGAIKVYPNPSRDQVFIEKEKEGEMKVSLRDMRGRILIEHTVSNSIDQLNLSQLPSGIYILNMRDENQASLNIRIQKL
ncbi:MAG: T9SS type A sorting domain-containing protein [Bacteroidota bacterium]